MSLLERFHSLDIPSLSSDVFNLLSIYGACEEVSLCTHSECSSPDRFNILEHKALGSNSTISNNLATREIIVLIF